MAEIQGSGHPEQGRLDFSKPLAPGKDPNQSIIGGERVGSDKESGEPSVYGPKPGEEFDDRPGDMHKRWNALRMRKASGRNPGPNSRR